MKLNKNNLAVTTIETPLGPMVAIADETDLYLLEFVESRYIERNIERLEKRTQRKIISSRSKPIDLIEKELKLYFKGELKTFKTSFCLLGSPFQNRVWEELYKIPHGETRSYAELARTIEKPTAFRAVALANAANQLAIIIPCHRIINSNGQLSGYAGGINRKQWLIDFEKS